MNLQVSMTFVTKITKIFNNRYHFNGNIAQFQPITVSQSQAANNGQPTTGSQSQAANPR